MLFLLAVLYASIMMFMLRDQQKKKRFTTDRVCVDTRAHLLEGAARDAEPAHAAGAGPGAEVGEAAGGVDDSAVERVGDVGLLVGERIGE